MSKPFDLEAAKRGEPIEFQSLAGGWTRAHFVGISLGGIPIIQHYNGGDLEIVPYTHLLRMAPKKRTVYVILAAKGYGWQIREDEESAKREVESYQRNGVPVYGGQAHPIEIEE